ncbi:MAG TPA: hypothetical protein VFT62_04330 [Mycobacteriales bacterium]|nr:hypothetical protein [Mycobacteriales bacterium]
MTSIPLQRTPVARGTARGTTAPEGPSSLTQLRRTGSSACPQCGSARLTSLAMTLTDGTPVQFASCHDCEHRHWSHEGAALAFSDVIARATKQKV